MSYQKNSLFTFLNYTFFIILGIVMMYPIWYVLMYSLSDPDKLSISSYYLIPQGFSLQAYKYVIREHFILTGYKNSIFVTSLGTLLSLLLTTISAYPLSKERLTGKKIFFSMMLFTMLFNGGLIPTFLVVRQIGLYDKLWALIIPNAVLVYYLLIMIKFFKQIPESLIESAKIDGYDDVAILFKIVLPLSTAVLASIGLFYAVLRWNEYLAGIIYISNTEKRVLPVIIRSLIYTESMAGSTGITGTDRTPENLRMAAIIVTMLPILCVYPLLQKHFMKGVLLGSVKG